MKLRARSEMLGGWEGSAELTPDAIVRPDGLPVLFLDGEDPVKPEEAAMFELEVLEASDGERAALVAAGYQLS